MRIAILVALFPPIWLAGTEIATYNIAKYLATSGYEIHVLTSKDEGLLAESVEQNIHVHRIRRSNVPPLGVISFWWQMFRILRRINPDIVHSQDISMGIPGFISKEILKIPFVVCGQGGDVYQPGLFTKLLSKLVLGNADAAIALTKDMKKNMQRICNRTINVIPNGIDLERFVDLQRNEVRDKLQIKPEEKLLIFVGGFRPVKGIRYLITALKMLQQQGQPVKLVLVGRGRGEKDLRRYVQQLDLVNSVIFTGQIPNENIPQFMAAADVFVLPSLSEGLPNVVLEAMASGLPIIATKVGGLPEIIEEGRNGFLVEPKNPKQIVEKILSIFGNDELRNSISANNREKIKEYSWDSVVDRLEKVYQEVTAKK